MNVTFRMGVGGWRRNSGTTTEPFQIKTNFNRLNIFDFFFFLSSPMLKINTNKSSLTADKD